MRPETVCGFLLHVFSLKQITGRVIRLMVIKELGLQGNDVTAEPFPKLPARCSVDIRFIPVEILFIQNTNNPIYINH